MNGLNFAELVSVGIQKVYNNQGVYHIVARSNNKDWFYLPSDELWEIFNQELKKCQLKFKFHIFAFVMMSNHYHLLMSIASDTNLGVVMQQLQRRISAKVNYKTGRVNHFFGGPYKASAIFNEDDYMRCFKYVLRNPIKAEITLKVEDYIFTASHISEHESQYWAMSSPLTARKMLIQKPNEIYQYLNKNEDEKIDEQIQRALRSPIFRLKDRNQRKILNY